MNGLLLQLQYCLHATGAKNRFYCKRIFIKKNQLPKGKKVVIEKLHCRNLHLTDKTVVYCWCVTEMDEFPGIEIAVQFNKKKITHR